MKKYKIYAVTISLAALIIGFCISMCLGEGHYFSRSGSVLAIVAVSFAFLKVRLDSAPRNLEEAIRKTYVNLVQQVKEQGFDDASSAKIVDDSLSDARNLLPVYIQKERVSLLKVELWIFVIGTIVWGFGDLIIDKLLIPALGL